MLFAALALALGILDTALYLNQLNSELGVDLGWRCSQRRTIFVEQVDILSRNDPNTNPNPSHVTLTM